MVILGYLILAFKVWMLIDAFRRRVHLLWFAVLMVPFGDWLYFIAVKLRDFNVRPAEALADEAPTVDLERLRALAEDSPSFHHRTQVAWALLEQGESAEAKHYFELGLGTHTADREALYGLGLSELKLGDHAAAIEALAELVERSPGYEDYQAALALAEALFAAGRCDDAFTLMHRVIRSSHRIEHRVELAKYELRADDKAQAQETLRAALVDFEAQPDFLRRRNGAVATEARRVLRTLDAQDEPNSR